MRVQMKIDIKKIQDIIPECKTIKEVADKLNMPYKSVLHKVKEYNLGKPNPGYRPETKMYYRGKNIFMQFIEGKSKAIATSSAIRKKLIKYNILKNVCNICGCDPIWNGKELILQLDHIDGNHHNNKLENLQIICPNCHSQTSTFCGKNKNKKSTKIDYTMLSDIINKHNPATMNELLKLLGLSQSQGNYNTVNDQIARQGIKTIIGNHCIICGCGICSRSKSMKCTTCIRLETRKCTRPSKLELINNLKQSNPYTLAKEYKVSDNSVRKWMRLYDIPTKTNEWKQYIQKFISDNDVTSDSIS